MTNLIKPNVHVVISSVSREIPFGRNKNNRIQKHQILARAGSAPYAGFAPREKEIAAYEKSEYSSRYDLKRKHEKQIS